MDKKSGKERTDKNIDKNINKNIDNNIGYYFSIKISIFLWSGSKKRAPKMSGSGSKKK